jgi:hypothetical protein
VASRPSGISCRTSLAAALGTYYISYAAAPEVTEQVLANMFLGRPPGNTDRILDFLDRGHRLPVLRAVRRLPR